jgi:hypothetical protein
MAYCVVLISRHDMDVVVKNALEAGRLVRLVQRDP